MKHLDEVALTIESEGYLENCYKLVCDRKAVAELVLDYADETIVASLKQVYLRDFGEKDDELQTAIRRVLKHYMSLKEIEEWQNETGVQL